MTIHFQSFERGIIIKGKPTIDDWRIEWQYQKHTAKSLPHILGDLLNYGYLTYGDKVEQELDPDDDCNEPLFSRGTLYNYKRVSRAWWPPERKVYPLAHGFYDATAPLPQKRQDRLMKCAVRFNLNRDQIRLLVARYQVRHGIQRTIAPRADDVAYDTMVQNHEIQKKLDLLSNAMREKDRHIAKLESTQATIEPAMDDLLLFEHGQIDTFAKAAAKLGYRGITIYADGRVMWIP